MADRPTSEHAAVLIAAKHAELLTLEKLTEEHAQALRALTVFHDLFSQLPAALLKDNERAYLLECSPHNIGASGAADRVVCMLGLRPLKVVDLAFAARCAREMNPSLKGKLPLP
jgi:hypothetical protein